MNNNLDLATVGKQFRSFRQKSDNKFSPFPCDFWEAAFALTKMHPINKVADAIGVDFYYFKKKLEENVTRAKKPKPDKISFIEASIPNYPLREVTFEISKEQTKTSLHMQLAFHEISCLMKNLL